MAKLMHPDQFGPADYVFAALKSVPGINDNLDERNEAREQMEQRSNTASARSSTSLCLLRRKR